MWMATCSVYAGWPGGGGAVSPARARRGGGGASGEPQSAPGGERVRWQSSES